MPKLTFEYRIIAGYIIAECLWIVFSDKGYIRFGYTVVNDEMEFFVEDTGIGIDPDFHQDICSALTNFK
jgi:hypothetical protein